MEFKCGYDCNYVDKPPKAYECPICLLVLRDPHMVDCCGREVLLNMYRTSTRSPEALPSLQLFLQGEHLGETASERERQYKGVL